MRKAIAAGVLLLLSAFVLAGCDRDDGPAIRKAIAQCNLISDDRMNEYPNIDAFYVFEAPRFRGCMQSRGIVYNINKANKPKCVISDPDPKKHDRGVWYAYIEPKCYQVDR